LGIKGNGSPPLITTALGIALVVTAVCVLSHRWLRLLTATRHADPDPRWIATLTTFAGLLLGVFVTLSSVGAGAIGMTALVLLYPRTPIARLVTRRHPTHGLNVASHQAIRVTAPIRKPH
jgi:uncharacterized membrane protein YfcA